MPHFVMEQCNTRYVRHNLTAEIHAPAIERLYRELFYYTKLDIPEIKAEAFRLLKVQFPDIRCTEKQFESFTKNKRIKVMRELENELHRDKVLELIEKYYEPDNKTLTTKKVFDEINQSKRLCNYTYVKEVVYEYASTLYLPLDEEWCDEYNTILLNCYYDLKYCTDVSASKYADAFFRKIGKRFDRKLVIDKLIEIMPEPKVDKQINFRKLDGELINTIKANTKEFLTRNLSYEQIVNKIQFFFRMEGYLSDEKEVHEILKSLNLITN